MNTNLPREYKQNIFSRIILKIKNFFFKKNNKKEIYQYNKESVEKEEEKNNLQNKLIESLRVEYTNNDVINNYNKDYEKRTLMKKLSDNPELLENFSIKRLEKILQWYREENDLKSKKLKRLNS